MNLFSGNLWRALSVDNQLTTQDFCCHAPPNLLARSWCDFLDPTRATSYLEQESKRLEWLKRVVEKRVNKHVGRSSLYLNIRKQAATKIEIKPSTAEIEPKMTAAVAPRETNGMLLNGDSTKEANSLNVSNKDSTVAQGFKDIYAPHLQDNEEDIVVDENGFLISGTLSALIRRLIPRKDYYPDKSYIFTFLLNARMFVCPADLLEDLYRTCVQEGATGPTEVFRKESKRKFFNNVVNLLAEWSDTFPYDFCPPLVKNRLKEILDLCCANDPTIRAHRMSTLQTLNNKLSKLERYENALTELQRETVGAVWPTDVSTGIVEKCSNAQTVAQQLTHIELERLSMIGAEEFVYAFAKECSSKDTAAFLMNHCTRARGAKNVEHYIEWCNRLSFLVATEICRHLKKKHRVKIIEFFIDVAKECFNMGNFNSLVAIAGAIDMNPVRRLKRTWPKINTSKWKILEHQTDPGGNFLSYRSTLKAAVWRSEGAKDDREKIIIPAFGILFRDLLSFYEQCKSPTSKGHLNYALFSEFAQHMRTFQQWKDAGCPFEKNEEILQYFLTTPIYNEKSLLLASYECEPPESHSEKEAHKRLRLEVQFSYSNVACDACTPHSQR